MMKHLSPALVSVDFSKLYSNKTGYISVADDSGICVDYLGGAPGIYSARYSGGNDKDNNNKH